MEIFRCIKPLIFNSKKLVFILILQLYFLGQAKCNDATINNADSVDRAHNHQQSKLKYHDVWYEINESIILNCSLRVNKDQHVVWHRKYDKVGVHVLTIGSETFISDLRIRPIKHHVSAANTMTTNMAGYINVDNATIFATETPSNDDYKLTWNLEIRRLKKDDTAFYYCVLNSENAYGQIYKLNVLSHLRFLNKSEIYMDETSEHLTNDEMDQEQNSHQQNEENSRSVTLACIYEDVIKNPKDQIKWYFNKHRIRNALDDPSTTQGPIKILNRIDADLVEHTTTNQFSSSFSPNHHFTITQSLTEDKNNTLSTLTIRNFNIKYNYGRYRCQYKGLIKTVRIFPNHRNESSTRLLYKQSVFSVASSSSSSSTSKTALFHRFFSPIHLFSLYLVFRLL